jgi:tetratricopeptide (TPR) repeat protein
MNEKPTQDSLELARGYRRRGKLNAAVETYRKVIASDPINVEAYLELAESLDKLQLYEDAEAACEKALAISPELARSHFVMGCIRAHQKRFTESEAEFKTAIELDPSSSDYYSYLSSVLGLQGNFMEAEFSLKRALEIDPNNSSLYVYLASVYRQTKQLAKSTEMARQAYRLAPSLANMSLLITSLVVRRFGIVSALLGGMIILSMAFRAVWTIPIAAIPLGVFTFLGISSLRTNQRSLGLLMLIVVAVLLFFYVTTQINGPVLR